MTGTGTYESVRGSTVVIDRRDRGLVTVTGPDAVSFLQSLVSQDVTALAVGANAHTLLLTPQGKLDVDTRLVRAGDDEVWLDTEPGFGEHLAEALTRFRIRVKADIADVSPDFAALAVRGPDAERLRERVEAPVRVLDAPWPFGGGFDAVGPRAAVDDLRSALLDDGAVACPPDVFETLRIEAGTPRQGADLDGATIPQEAFLEQDAVSFTKGCFLGQELVCRIDSRGHVNRFLRSVRVAGDARPPVGAELVAGDKVVGSLTSVTPDPDLPWFGLAFVRRESDPPADVVVRWPGGEVGARVEATPASAAATAAS